MCLLQSFKIDLDILNSAQIFCYVPKSQKSQFDYEIWNISQ